MMSTDRDSLLAKRAELINHEFDRLGRAEARISKAEARILRAAESINSAEKTRVYARLNAGRYLIEAKILLGRIDPDADFEAWCAATSGARCPIVIGAWRLLIPATRSAPSGKSGRARRARRRMTGPAAGRRSSAG